MSYSEFIETSGGQGQLTERSIAMIKETIKSTRMVLPNLVSNFEPNAFIVGAYIDGFKAVYGYIFDDKTKRWSDGHQIRTSTVLERVEIFENVYKVRTRNSTYVVLE
ncbi:hypothetical protein CPT_Muldoon_218 [Serratia phage Muldoon]|uniref:Uncharacterized protein n=1 Tax=Serratia phage Muldoon TaxID=2601678 RepID=A0A5P8PHM7_9CAUD|nr:hypothetical protein HYP94_gp172 [Serratia phage Muldoon]QFR56169.1 hypothetical protein CPT_Muldoon_218 [Serratia phage Muldoon]WDS61759.1 hypothetical protein [Cronobacter phage vB_Cdu_VP8]